MKRLRFDPLAERELAEAAAYYEEKSEGLGGALLDEAASALRQIESAPLSAPLVDDPLRSRPLFRFPYRLLYRVHQDEVEIVAFMHGMRGPKYIASRLR